MSANKQNEIYEITPQNNTEFFGHEDILKQLTSSLQIGKMASSLLLSGPKGIGKTTLAFRMARFLLAKESERQEFTNFTINPYCPTFTKVSNNCHPDLKLIQRELTPSGKLSSDIKIDQVRVIKNFMSMTPYESKWRVVIIDSIDDLNINAANSILKILEEPPSGSLIILISHLPGKLLPTIESRCRNYKMHRLNESDSTKVIKHSFTNISPESIITNNGTPGQDVYLHQMGAEDIHKQVIEIFASGFDTAKIQNFATIIASAKEQNKWQLFAYSIEDILTKWIKSPFTNTGIYEQDAIFAKLNSKIRTDKIIEARQKTLQLLSDLDRLNLDKTAVVFSIFKQYSSL